MAKDAGSAVMAYTQAAMPFSLIFMDVSDSQSGVDAAGRLLRAIEVIKLLFCFVLFCPKHPMRLF